MYTLKWLQCRILCYVTFYLNFFPSMYFDEDKYLSQKRLLPCDISPSSKVTAPHPGLYPKPSKTGLQSQAHPERPWAGGAGGGGAGSQTAEVSPQLSLHPHLDLPPTAFSSLLEAGGRARPRRTQVTPMPCHRGPITGLPRGSASKSNRE